MPCWDTVCCLDSYVYCWDFVSLLYACLCALILFSVSVICFLCESLFLSSSVGMCSTYLFTFEFISRYCTLFCPTGRERGVWHRAAHRRSLPAGPSEGQAGACCSVPLLPLLFGSPGVRLLYAPPDATFVPARRSPLRAGLNQGVRM